MGYAIRDMDKLLDKYQVPIGNSSNTNKEELPIDAVDQMADILIKEYDNSLYRRWYCGVIYDYGFAQVEEWRNRASEGREPAKLFSKYVKEARTYKSRRDSGGVP